MKREHVKTVVTRNLFEAVQMTVLEGPVQSRAIIEKCNRLLAKRGMSASIDKTSFSRLINQPDSPLARACTIIEAIASETGLTWMAEHLAPGYDIIARREHEE